MKKNVKKTKLKYNIKEGMQIPNAKCIATRWKLIDKRVKIKFDL